jgi:hypothetical protein
MILYLAGNFPSLNNIKEERKILNNIQGQEKEYHRLVSFYYPKTIDTVLKLKKEKEK